MLSARTLSLPLRRFVCALGALSILAGLGLDVHATVMLLHQGHGTAAVTSAVADDDHHRADHAHSAEAGDAHGPGHPHHAHGGAAGDGKSGESTLECCNATLCPSGLAGLPSLACAAASDRLDGAIALTGNVAAEGLGPAPLLRPPR